MSQMIFGIPLVKDQQTNLYKFGASAAEACPPKIQMLPTTNQMAKKQSKAILKWSIIKSNLQKEQLTLYVQNLP